MEKNINISHSIMMLLSLLGVVLHIFGFGMAWLVLASGAMGLFFIRLFVRVKCKDKNMVRLLSILMFGSVLLLGASYLMYSGRHYWVIPLMIDAVVEFYVSVRMGH